MNKIVKAGIFLRYQFKLIPYYTKALCNKLFYSKSVFHDSYEMDLDLMLKMNARDREKYLKDLTIRREKVIDINFKKKDKIKN